MLFLDYNRNLKNTIILMALNVHYPQMEIYKNIIESFDGKWCTSVSWGRSPHELKVLAIKVMMDCTYHMFIVLFEFNTVYYQ